MEIKLQTCLELGRTFLSSGAENPDRPFPGFKFDEFYHYLGQYRLVKLIAWRGDGFRVYWGENKDQPHLVVKLAGTRGSFYQAMNEARLYHQKLIECPHVPKLVDIGFDAEMQCFVFVHTPLGQALDRMIESL